MNIYQRIIYILLPFASAQVCEDNLPDSSAAACSRHSNHTVVAPLFLRPGFTFSVIVEISKELAPVNVTAGIISNELGWIVQSQGNFSAGEIGSLDLQIPTTLPQPSKHPYKLVIFGNGGGTEFTEDQKLLYILKHLIILIQTDKPIYKPQQTVYFRILALYPSLLPYRGPFDVEIVDPNGFRMHYLHGVRNESYGVITQSMLISSEPVLGYWSITASAEGQEETCKFVIEEYVLPKIEVNLIVPPFLTNADSHLHIQINSRYTFNKPFNGLANLTIIQFYGGHILQRTLLFNGTANVAVSHSDIVTLMKLNEAFHDNWDLSVSVTITDSTGVTAEASASFVYTSTPVTAKLLSIVSEEFSPGLPYAVFVKLSRRDSSPLSDSERDGGVRIEIAFYSNHVYWGSIKEDWSIPPTDLVSVTFEVPPSITLFRIHVDIPLPTSTNSYQRIVNGLKYKKYSQSKAYLQTIVNGRVFKVGEEVTLTVYSTAIPSKLIYLVVAQSNIVLYDMVDNWRNETNLTVTFTANEIMSPNARVIVFYQEDGGGYVTDSVNIYVERIPKYQVNVSYDRTISEPGDHITFIVNATPYSLVEILAVDESVLLLKSTNEITQKQVTSKLYSLASNCNIMNDFSPEEFSSRGGCLNILGRIWTGYPEYIFVSAGVFTLPNRLGSLDDITVFDTSHNEGDAIFGITSLGGANPVAAEEIQVRQHFPETWLWSEHIADVNGQVKVKTKVPDTITSWIGSAFAVSLSDGIGIGEAFAKTTVFKPFFVFLNLPYSVIRGETLILEAIVYNYFDEEVKATVTLKKSTQFETITLDEENIERTSSDNMVEIVTAPPRSLAQVWFHIKPTEVGLIEIEVQAVTDQASDAVRRHLLVEPEGVTHSVTENRIMKEETYTAFEEVFNIRLPPSDKMIPDSLRVLLSVTGDVMSHTMNNLGRLLQLPVGCGEQNILRFAPNAFVYKYLTLTDQHEEVIVETALEFMKTGYQNELKYRHSDGSFSAFGDVDPSGSTWLTSFVIKSFVDAFSFITIDKRIIEEGLSFIIHQQNVTSGFFQEPGEIIHRAFKVSDNLSINLTAYVTAVLQEILDSSMLSNEMEELVRLSISRGQSYLEEQIDVIYDDAFAMSLVTLALARTGSDRRFIFRHALDRLTIHKDGRRYWTSQKSVENELDGDEMTASDDIVMTANALQTYLLMEDLQTAANIAKWLLERRTFTGGFTSSQDSVAALDALSAYALQVYVADPEMNLTVTISSDSSYSQELTINSINTASLQQIELPTQSGEVTVNGWGKGTCVMTLTLFYNLLEVKAEEAFEFSVIFEDDNESDGRAIKACGRFIGNEDATNMCIMDISIPSGFAADVDNLKKVRDVQPLVKRIETVRQSVYFYFEEIPKDNTTCVEFSVTRFNMVKNARAKYAKLYDYYNPAAQTVVSYSGETGQESDVPDCQVCTGDGRRSFMPLLQLAVASVLTTAYILM